MIDPLLPEQLYAACDPTCIGFENTTELEPLKEVIGQKRAIAALSFGTRISNQGHNIYAMGQPGTGRFTAIQEFLKQEASQRPVPSDWCYVYNFKQPHKPRALALPAGRGVRLRADMEQLIEDLGSAIPAAFETEDYQTRIEELTKELAERRNRALGEVAEEAGKKGIRLLHTPGGFAFAPVNKDDEVIGPEDYEKLPDDEKEKIERSVDALQKDLQRAIRSYPIWQKETREKVKALDREIASYTIVNLIAEIKERHKDLQDVLEYLLQVENDVVEHVQEFREPSQAEKMFMQVASAQGEALRRYQVNLLVDHVEGSGAPVVYQSLPTHANLVGRVEYRAQMGTLITDFTLIRSGDLHQANGGYLILDALRVLSQPFAWDSLKRALGSREIHIEPLEKTFGLMSTVSLEPEPIPLDIKIVLIGSRLMFYLLNEYDPEFADLFMVTADFDDVMPRSPQDCEQYARLLATIVKRESIRPLDRSAVARTIEFSSRLAEDSEKLSVHARSVSRLLVESDYWATESGRDVITADDIQQAIDAQVYRLDRVREKIYEAIQRGTLRIDTTGEKVGQVNGLSVLDLGEFSFGQPSRITATARLGSGKFVDIQRETELGGKIHSKGVLILSNYLAAHYARDYPLSVSASLVFEQSYGMVEGDSASLAELCALLSALSGIAIRQNFAVTGSVNQLGEVQAIGGVNQKIEGYYDVCNVAGLDGTQGVIIPRSNVPHLMLRHDVVDAVREGRFFVYAVETVNQAIALLTGVDAGERGADGVFPADSVNDAVERALIDLARRRRIFSKEGEDNGSPETLSND